MSLVTDPMKGVTVKTKQRWRAVGVDWRGYLIARVKNQDTGEIVGVYQRRPKTDWLLYDGADSRVKDRALATTAARAVAATDVNAARREFRQRIQTQAAALAERKLKVRR